MDLAALVARPLPLYTAATVLVVGGLSVALAAFRLREAYAPIRTWLVMLPVALGALWLGQGAWTALVTIVAIAGFREYSRATGLARVPLFPVVVVAAIVAQNAAAFLGRYDLFMAAPMWAIFGLALVPIVLRRTEAMLQWLSLSILGVLLYGFCLAHLTYLAASPLGPGLLLFVLLGTQLNDALQFIYGKLLGRHRWTPISPNKTVEGSLLALATTVALAFAQWPLAFPHLPAAGALLVGLIVGIGGQVGDLTMANVKRSVGIKDFGNLLPGHGGITDRVNSLMVTVPVFAHVVGFLWGGWPQLEPGWIVGMGA